MTAIRSSVAPFIVLLASLVMPACYTLLKHPTVDTAAYEEVDNNACTSCHYEDELWYFHHAPGHRLYPGGYDAGWAFYYGAPWWYDSFWRYGESGGARMIPLESRRTSPELDKGRIDGASGFPIGPPPDPKSTGSVLRAKDTGDRGDGKGGPGENKRPDIRSKDQKRERKDDDRGKDGREERKKDKDGKNTRKDQDKKNDEDKEDG